MQKMRPKSLAELVRIVDLLEIAETRPEAGCSSISNAACCAAGGGVKANRSPRPPPDRRLSSNESCYAMSASGHRPTDGEGAKAKKKGGPVRGRRRWTFRRSTCSARALAEERRCLLWVISGYRSGAIQFLLLWNTPVEFHNCRSGSGALRESPKTRFTPANLE